MNWIDQLESLMWTHLCDHHHESTYIHDERKMFVEFLVYSEMKEGDHTVICPFTDCTWEKTFNIAYTMELKQ